MPRLKATKSITVETASTFPQIVLPRLFLVIVGTLAVFNLVFPGQQAARAQDESSSTVTSSILEVPSSEEGVNLKFTLYNGQYFQYFSAGVGIEERKAVYPGYPLKLIFVQGARAYLAEVNISILKADGTTLVEIPSAHVMGPWLFVNIPSGTYTITATDSRGRAIKKQVKLGEERTKVVHFRWPAL